jgi:hypothetical protein
MNSFRVGNSFKNLKKHKIYAKGPYNEIWKKMKHENNQKKEISISKDINQYKRETKDEIVKLRYNVVLYVNYITLLVRIKKILPLYLQKANSKIRIP